MAEKKPVKKKEEKKDSHKHAAKPQHKAEGGTGFSPAFSKKAEAKHSHEGHKHPHKDEKDLKQVRKEEKEVKKPAAVAGGQKSEKGTGKIADKVDRQKMLHAYQTLIHPLITEKAINMIETENKLVFVVRNNATKQEVKKAVEELYGVKVDSVNIMRDMKARKRAFVRINEKYRADEIATKLGVL